MSDCTAPPPVAVPYVWNEVRSSDREIGVTSLDARNGRQIPFSSHFSLPSASLQLYLFKVTFP